MITFTLVSQDLSTNNKTWTFPDQEIIRIGRASDNDVVLEQYLQVSRHHLEIRRDDSNNIPQWQLVSRGTNGTFVNGVLITQGLITNHSCIQLAEDGPTLEFTRKSSSVVVNSLVNPAVNTPEVNNCDHEGNLPQNLFCVHCGKPIVEKEFFVKQYQVLRTIGQGGMGTTYLAWDQQGTISGDPQLLVLKEMNSNMEKVPKAKELFEREARILKSLQHSGIPQYYDFFIENQKKYLAMELVHGQDLEKMIHQQGTITVEQGVKWMLQVCDILTYLHSLNPPLVHRDVKPANIMIRKVDNNVVLLDFGAVKEIGTPLGTRIGAEGYTAPEQARGKPCPQSDVYAIAPTLIFLLTGQNPLKFYNFKRGGSRFDLSAIATITPQLQQVIEQASETKLKQRYPNAKALSQALQASLHL